METTVKESYMYRELPTPVEILFYAYNHKFIFSHCARFVPESFRWYVSHNRNEDAEKVVQFIGKVNGYGDVNKDMLHEVTEAEKAILEEHLADKKYSFLDIFKHRHILKFTLLLAWIWYVNFILKRCCNIEL